MYRVLNNIILIKLDIAIVITSTKLHLNVIEVMKVSYFK